MTKTSIQQSLKWLFLALLAAYTFGYTITLTLDTLFGVPESTYKAIPTILIMIIFGHFFYRIYARLDNHLPLKEKRQLKATNARSITVNGTHKVFMSAMSSIFPSEAPQSPTSVLWWQYGNYTIREDTAYEWLRKGWNRQLKNEPHPFSGNWMIHQRFHTLGNQTIDRAYHDSICELVRDYQLWLKEPKQGTSGKVIASPAGCISKLQGKW